MPLGIGPLELIIVLVIALVIFGPKRLPDLGRSLGSGMREFKESITGNSKDDEDPATLNAPRSEDATQRDDPATQRDDPATQRDDPATQRDDAVTRGRG